LFVFFSFFHTGTTVFTSTAQPDFINRFFGLKGRNTAAIVQTPEIREPALSGRV